MVVEHSCPLHFSSAFSSLPVPSPSGLSGQNLWRCPSIYAWPARMIAVQWPLNFASAQTRLYTSEYYRVIRTDANPAGSPQIKLIQSVSRTLAAIIRPRTWRSRAGEYNAAGFAVLLLNLKFGSSLSRMTALCILWIQRFHPPRANSHLITVFFLFCSEFLLFYILNKIVKRERK